YEAATHRFLCLNVKPTARPTLAATAPPRRRGPAIRVLPPIRRARHRTGATRSKDAGMRDRASPRGATGRRDDEDVALVIRGGRPRGSDGGRARPRVRRERVDRAR